MHTEHIVQRIQSVVDLVRLKRKWTVGLLINLFPRANRVLISQEYSFIN